MSTGAAPPAAPDVRTGLGWDSHRLVPGRALVLGGVHVPSDVGLHGHSDADVLAHAVADAVLGAAGLGDIGEHFPDDDPRWAGADSIALLREVGALVAARGLRVTGLDATVVLERPKLREHKAEMARRLAGALGLEVARVNVKASTAERLDAVGRGEGAVAMAVATLVGAAG